MKWSKIESIFKYRGYECVVVFTSMGHRCGYVAVSATSPLFKIDYDTDLNLASALEQLNNAQLGHRSVFQILLWNGKTTKMSIFCNVHGGVTYSKGLDCYPITRPYPLWWFGFDCAHYGDLKDLKKLAEYYPEIMYVDIFKSGKIRRLNYVKGHCKKLVRQIMWLEQELNK